MVLKNKIHLFFLKYFRNTYPKNKIIISAYDVPDGVYFLETGYVRMYSSYPDGKELTLNIFKPGTYFPMIWALADVENNYFFETLTAATVFKAPKEKVIEYLNKNPDELFDLTKRILNGVNGVLNNPDQLYIGSAYQRVISVLFMCARRFGKHIQNNAVLIDLPLTHQDIANICGLVRETVTIELLKLTKNKVISFQNRKVIVLNMKNLEDLRESFH